MYCYVIYHPASFPVAEFYLSVTRKYCFPTSFDKWPFSIATLNYQWVNQSNDRMLVLFQTSNSQVPWWNGWAVELDYESRRHYVEEKTRVMFDDIYISHSAEEIPEW